MNILRTLSFVFVYGVRFIEVQLLRKGDSCNTPSSVSDVGYTRNENIGLRRFYVYTYYYYFVHAL